MESVVFDIRALDLAHWSERVEAAAQLPALIRRLIAATSDLLDSEIGAHEDVRLPGWDGIVNCQQGNSFVPAGLSCWEFSVEQAINRKADGDYEKRVQNPLRCDPATSTFVYVSPRKWRGKKAWRDKKAAEGHWRDVRALDASDLERWLEGAPSVHLWFLGVLGRARTDVEALTTFWDRWSGATDPPLSPAMLLAGREHAAERVEEWIAAAPGPLSLQADSRDEATAFVAAVFLSQSRSLAERLSSRAVIARSFSAATDMATHPESLVILIAEAQDQALPTAASRHHLLIALDPTTPAPDAVVLPRLNGERLRAALGAAGLPPAIAESVSRHAGARVAPLRRRLAHPGTPRISPWSDPQAASGIAPLLLLGAWDEARTSDVVVVEAVTRRSYNDLAPLLVRWQNSPDPPFVRRGSIWQWVSRADAWWLLIRFVAKTDLDAFEAAALRVLGLKNPAFDLAPSERWLAGVQGKIPQQSSALRAGMADTLGLLGAAEESRSAQDSEDPQDRASRIVFSLLRSDDAELWASLSDVLTVLAEAAPQAFLDSLDRFSNGVNPSVIRLFAEQQGGLFPRSDHTALLWALEGLAWNPRLLPHVTVLLGRLARLDPGGSLANRPSVTLRHVFLGWYPQAGGSFELRLDALDALMKAEPEVAWRTLLAVGPALGPDHSWPLHRPRWRTWHEAWNEGVSWAEYDRHVRAVADRLVEAVGDDPNRWCSLLEKLSSLPAGNRATLLKRFEELARTEVWGPAGVDVWHGLRKLLHLHRKHPDARWALSPDELKCLDRVFQGLTPSDPLERYAWLYAWHPQLPEPPARAIDDWRVEEEAANSLRKQATAELLRTGGAALLLLLADKVEEPDFLGRFVGWAELTSEEDQQILETALAQAVTGPRLRFLGAYVHVRQAVCGWAWAERAMAGREPAVQVRIGLGLPFNERTWDLMIQLGPEAERLYWSEVRPFLLDDKGAQAERALRRLLAAGRPWVALVLAEYCFEDGTRALLIPADLAAEVLERAAQSEAGRDSAYTNRQHGYHVGELIGALEKESSIAESRLARLEWLWLPTLSNSERHCPEILYRVLGRDPSLFADLVSWIFRPASQRGIPAQEPSEEHRARGERAWDLLHHWRRVPGLREDGTLDGDRLRGWVLETRRQCEARDRAEIGDQQIGQVLAHSPGDGDGKWPAASVRELVEELASTDIEAGLRVGIMNRRGVFTRAIGTGGEQERELATKYREWAAASTKWPRTARVLESIAESYERQARREDDEAERYEE